MATKNYFKREVRIEELYTGEAKCAEIGDHIFFAKRDEPTTWTIRAKKVCLSCPLLEKCRDYAIQNAVAGVWGGTTQHERERIRVMLGIIPKQVEIGNYY